MAHTNVPPRTSPARDDAPQDPEICPQCGHALYECECPDRWENEGGATPPPDESAAP